MELVISSLTKPQSDGAVSFKGCICHSTVVMPWVLWRSPPGLDGKAGPGRMGREGDKGQR